MAISTSVLIIASWAMMILLFNVAPAESRPAFCADCTDEEKARCPTVVANATCQVVETEGCECCRKVCAAREGEFCGVGRSPCEDHLFCLPPNMQDEDYIYPEDPDLTLFGNGNFICQPLPDHTPDDIRRKINDPVAEFDDGYYYYDDDENVEGPLSPYDEHESEYTEQQQQQSSSSSTTSDDTVVPDLMPVYIPSETPPSAPFPDNPIPCKYHSDQAIRRVNSLEELDRHQWMPACHHLGRHYMPEQCETTVGTTKGRCWCVDIHGAPITDFIKRERSSMTRCEQRLMRAK